MATQFCTVANVNERWGTAAALDAAVLGTIIDGVSLSLARSCGRADGSAVPNLMLRQSARTEYTQGNGGNMLFLDVWPIESITSITLADDKDWDNGETLTAEDDYRHDAVSGIIYRVSGKWRTVIQSIRLIYVGGYVDPTGTPTGSQIALPDDIIEAAILQTVHEYQRRRTYGAKSIEGDDRSLIYHQATPLLARPQEIMDGYRREVFY